MSTVGKILVVLNTALAALVVAFFVLDFAAQTNNQAVTKLQEEQLRVARIVNIDLANKNTKIALEVQASVAALEAERQQRALDRDRWLVDEDALRSASNSARALAERVKLNQQKVDEAQKRMVQEVRGLEATVEKKDGDLVGLHKKFTSSRDLEMALDRDVKFLKALNKVLEDRNSKLEVVLSDLKNPAGVGLAKNPMAPNPPAKFLRGVVERVDGADSRIALVSLGTDHGLNVDNTLEVFRLSPSPEYLGMIRIQNAHPQASVGKLVVQPGTPPRTIRAGDLVGSNLNPR